ncbi:major facilitator transporter [Alcanivorax xiamenensis]|uniref:Major facilitator transporter n=1 Tax=Alcanivorax xiamenensis TaxID=1177156 RepID=A0ABQ6Y6H7_9GAMM|nr:MULTISPECIES: MFS transporter [Alcanivorax]KAF0804543.1 major facilitator transporter [Alcanivorax xiamenensis]
MTSYREHLVPSSSTDRAGPRQWAGLAVLALPTLLLGLDVTLLYLAFPALAAELKPDSTQALWIMDIYGFFISGFLITMGTLGDRIGRRKLLMLGAGGFALASVLAAFSTTATQLIVARALLGFTGAALMPSTLALISNLFRDPPQRALAIGIWATMFALGMAAGPLVGGVLLDHFWWGSAFLVALPVVAILWLSAPWLLPEYRDEASGRLDLGSVVLSLVALLPLIYGVKQFARHGLDWTALIALLIGALGVILFIKRQHRLADPLLDLSLFRSRSFTAALLILLVGLMGVGGAMLLVTQYLQLVSGLTPRVAGAWMGPPALAMLVAAISAPLLARRFPVGQIVAGALLLSVLGYLTLAGVDAEARTIQVVSGFALVYLGLGAIAALGTDLVVAAAPADKAGSAASLSETVQELGVALGVAMLGSLSSGLYRIGAAEHFAGTASAAVKESLWQAVSSADRLPAGVLDQARDIFTQGLNLTALITAVGIGVLAMVPIIALRGGR